MDDTSDKQSIMKTFLFFIWSWWNLVKFHQNWMKNKKVFIIDRLMELSSVKVLISGRWIRPKYCFLKRGCLTFKAHSPSTIFLSNVKSMIYVLNCPCLKLLGHFRAIAKDKDGKDSHYPKRISCNFHYFSFG